MALVFSFDPKRTMGGMYDPVMSRQGYKEGTHTGLLEKGAGAKALAGMKSYDEYMKAYSSDPSKYAKSYNPARLGYTPGGGNYLQKATSDPFTEAEFNRFLEGQNIASGANLRAAAERGMAGIPDATAEYANKFGGGTQMFDYYKNLLMGTDDFTQTPEYQEQIRQSEEMVRRTNPRLSGRRAIAAIDEGQKRARLGRTQALSDRLAAAEQERLRGAEVQGRALEAARMQAELAMRPEEMIFKQYWNPSAGGYG